MRAFRNFDMESRNAISAVTDASDVPRRYTIRTLWDQLKEFSHCHFVVDMIRL